jgi:hypothetical protein
MDNERYTVKSSSYTNWGTMISAEQAKQMVSAQNEWDKIAPAHMIDQVDKGTNNYIKVLVDYNGNDNFPKTLNVISVDSLIKSSINLLSTVAKNIDSATEIMDFYCLPDITSSLSYLSVRL